MMTSKIKLDSTVTGQQEFVLVPRTPTKEMLEAAWADALAEDAMGVWRAMVERWESSCKQGELGQGEPLVPPLSEL
jgi:hypothetical protein